MNAQFENINLRNYVKFIFPTIFSMVFISIYTMTDGIFVSNRLGSNALAALNVTMPAFTFIFGSIFMIIIGSSAIIGIHLGAKEVERANQCFSNMAYALGCLAIFYVLVGLFFTDPIAKFLGSTEVLAPYAKDYLFILFIGAGAFVIKLFTETFLRLEGRFTFSLVATIVGGLANILFDYVFMYIFDMGISGAALGTILGALINGLFGVGYFAFKKSKLKFAWVKIDWNFYKEALLNGSSEMVTTLSGAFVTFLFNSILIKTVGEIGVSSISIVLYINMFLSSIFIGISMGIQPLLSYNFGAKNIHNIHKLLKISCTIIVCISFISFSACHLFKYQLIGLFNKENTQLISMTAGALQIVSFSFFINGFNILSSGFFTALNNGKYSAIISFSRSFIFKAGLIISFPPLLGITGAWLTLPLSEVLCLTLTLYFFSKIYRSHLKLGGHTPVTS